MKNKYKVWIALILILTLPSINACSVVMFGTMGTDYEDKINKNSSIDKVHKLLGQPISAETYNRPLDSNDISATKSCSRPFPLWIYDDKPTQQHREIMGFEVYKIKGVVRTFNSPPLDGTNALAFDLITLGLAEIVLFPMATIYWADGERAEKDMTIWYGINNTFEGGEIRYSKTNELITNIHIWCPRKIIQQTEM